MNLNDIPTIADLPLRQDTKGVRQVYIGVVKQPLHAAVAIRILSGQEPKTNIKTIPTKEQVLQYCYTDGQTLTRRAERLTPQLREKYEQEIENSLRETQAQHIVTEVTETLIRKHFTVLYGSVHQMFWDKRYPVVASEMMRIRDKGILTFVHTTDLINILHCRDDMCKFHVYDLETNEPDYELNQTTVCAKCEGKYHE